nr:CRISPR-associated protein Cas5 [uncultured Dyadobacter sp.]
MLFCTVHLKSVTASFRNPDFQNFHKSFALPPPTALAGIAGAALGLNPKAAQAFLVDDAFEIGVTGLSKGMARDLWKYDTLPGRSVITRELYINSEFHIAFGCENHESVEKLYAAFRSPVYSLTLGQSDSLAKIGRIQLTDKTEQGHTLNHTLVEGDIVPLILEQALLGGSYSLTISQNDPVAYNLPTRFLYESDYGVRRVVARKLFSFVGPAVTIQNRSFKGVRSDDVFIPTFLF